MQKIIMLKGLPASGKSTYAREAVLVSRGNIKSVNKDTLRDMLDAGEWSRVREEFILKIRDCLVRESLQAGNTVIVDDTNFAPKHDMIVQDLTKPRVIICDLDGTIAILGKRSPYDASTCEEDKMNHHIVELIMRLDMTVIFISGRKDTYKLQTLRWLDKVFPDMENKMLFMRRAEDNRKDSIVKKEIYDIFIKPYYYVVGIFDDRNQVVEMWRSLGLTCLQVAEGDF